MKPIDRDVAQLHGYLDSHRSGPLPGQGTQYGMGSSKANVEGATKPGSPFKAGAIIGFLLGLVGYFAAEQSARATAALGLVTGPITFGLLFTFCAWVARGGVGRNRSVTSALKVFAFVIGAFFGGCMGMADHTPTHNGLPALDGTPTHQLGHPLLKVIGGVSALGPFWGAVLGGLILLAFVSMFDPKKNRAD